MKRILCAALCAALLLGALPLCGQAATLTENQQIGMYAMYADYIESIHFKQMSYEADYTENAYFYFDLDSDGFQELIVQTGILPEDRNFEVYGIRGGKLTHICEFWGANASLYVSENGSRLLRLTVSGYHQILSELAVKNDKAEVTVLWDRTSAVYDDHNAVDYPAVYWSDFYEVRFPGNPTAVQKRWLRALKALARMFDTDDRYFFMDMNGDGAYELIREHVFFNPSSDFDDSTFYSVYTYSNGSFQAVGTVEIPRGQVGDNGLAKTRGQSGFLSFEAYFPTRVYLSGGSLQYESYGYTDIDDVYAYYSPRAIGAYGFYSIMAFSDADLYDPLTPGTPYRAGDPSGDGLITAEDARLALRQAVGLEHFTKDSAAFTACDVIRDGAVTAEDARLILRVAVNIEFLTDGAPTV